MTIRMASLQPETTRKWSTSSRPTPGTSRDLSGVNDNRERKKLKTRTSCINSLMGVTQNSSRSPPEYHNFSPFITVPSSSTRTRWFSWRTMTWRRWWTDPWRSTVSNVTSTTRKSRRSARSSPCRWKYSRSWKVRWGPLVEDHLLTTDNSHRPDSVHVLACSHSQMKILITIPFLWLAVLESKSDPECDSKPNCYIVLCRTFHIAQTSTLIPAPYFCIGQESE